MKLVRMFACAVPFVLGGCSSPPAQDTETAVSSSTAQQPEGTWQISECSFYGESNPARIGDKLSIARSGPSTIEREGTPLPLELTLEDNGNPGQFNISFATNEDSPAMGGSGPRPGLLQLSDNGHLEMLVAGSAIDNRPTDFSPTQKSQNIYYQASAVAED